MNVLTLDRHVVFIQKKRFVALFFKLDRLVHFQSEGTVQDAIRLQLSVWSLKCGGADW